MLSVSLLLFFTSQFICVLSTLSVNDVKHIGCYNASWIKSYRQVGTYINPFTWESCVNLCYNELTVYAGIFPSYHKSKVVPSSGYVECVCTNHIAEFSPRVNDSLCDGCPDNSTSCSSSTTISLYQLTSSTSPRTAVLITTEHSLQRMILEATPQVTTFQTLPEGASAIAFEARNRILVHFLPMPIFYTQRNKIFMIRYDAISTKYKDPELLLEVDCKILDLIYDGLHRESVVFICPTKMYTASLSSYFTVNETVKLLFEENNSSSVFHHIDYDPFNSNFYSVRNTTLDVSRWNTKGWTPLGTDILKDYGFAVMQIAADKQKETVYVIGSFVVSTKLHLVTINYPLTSLKVVYSGPELANAFDLDVFSGEVIWGSGDANNYTLYRGVISSKYELENIEAIHIGTEKINDLKIYHSEMKHVHKETVKKCKKKMCSHRCSRMVRRDRVVCACADTMVLDDDGKTCIVSNTTSTASTTLAPATPDSE